MLRKMTATLAVILSFMITFTIVFADVNINEATFEIDGSSVTSISLAQGECKTLRVTFYGVGSITGNISTEWLKHPESIIIDSSGNLQPEGEKVIYYNHGQTMINFDLNIEAADDANFTNIIIDLFEGVIKGGSGGGKGKFISFGSAIKIKHDATANINVTYDDGEEEEEYSDIFVTKTVDQFIADVGDEIVYTITVSNNGPDDASGVVVNDLLPLEMEYVSHIASQGTYDKISGVWDIDHLANESYVTLQIKVKPKAGAAGETLTNTASLTDLDQINSITDNDTDSVDVYVTAVDILLSKSVDANLPNSDNQITFTISVTNNGPDDASGVVVTDNLPVGLVYVDSDSVDVNIVGQAITWNVGDLAKEDTKTLTINARVEVAGTFVNNALVAHVDQYDLNNDNDEATVSIDIGELKVIKFYDANVNGLNDSETELDGWMFLVEYDLDGEGEEYGRETFGNVYSGTSLFFVSGTEVRVTEGRSRIGTWVPTTVVQQVAVLTNETVILEFGNVCLGNGGGKTLGFWSNKNGQALITNGGDLGFLYELNLRDSKGNAFNPTNYSTYKKWLLNGDAVNMAYMLSVQLSAMEMNVYNGLVDNNAIIYAPYADCANELGFVSISTLMTYANDLLSGINPIMIGSDSPDRAKFEAVKNALDRANNNMNFIQMSPCLYGDFEF